MTDRTIRVEFVGAGANTRRHHIPKLRAQPGIELVAVANRTKESGERVAREFGIARVYGDWRELVRAPDIDVVCIEDGVRYMEFTESVWKSAASGQAVDVAEL